MQQLPVTEKSTVAYFTTEMIIINERATPPEALSLPELFGNIFNPVIFGHFESVTSVSCEAITGGLYFLLKRQTSSRLLLNPLMFKCTVK